MPLLQHESQQAGMIVWDLLVQRVFLDRQIALSPCADTPGRQPTPLYSLTRDLAPNVDRIRILRSRTNSNDELLMSASYVVELSASDGDLLRETITEQLEVPEELAFLQSLFEMGALHRVLSQEVAERAGLV